MSSPNSETSKTNKTQIPDKYIENIEGCTPEEECQHHTQIKVKIGNNLKILLLLRHYDEEYYLIIHHADLIVAYPMEYKRVTPYKSIYYYTPFYESNNDSYQIQNERGRERCVNNEDHKEYTDNRPDFEGFRENFLSICCSCADRANVFESIKEYFAAIPSSKNLHCIKDTLQNRKNIPNRSVAIKRTVRHLSPFYAIFRFKNEKQIFLHLHISVSKKKKTFSEYYQMYTKNDALKQEDFHYLINETSDINLFDKKFLSVRHSANAFNYIKEPQLYGNYLLVPVYSTKEDTVTYDPLGYGCSYNNYNYDFPCVEDKHEECTYDRSSCLRHSVYINENHVSDSPDACGMIGYTDDSIFKIENCTSSTKCVQTTVETYINKAYELTKGQPEKMIKLPLYGDSYPHYIYKKKKNYEDIVDKKSEAFLNSSSLNHYVAYNIKKQDRTELIITIYNKLENVISAANLNDGTDNIELKSEDSPGASDGIVGSGDKAGNGEKTGSDGQAGSGEQAGNDATSTGSNSSTNEASASPSSDELEKINNEERKKYNIYDGVVFYLEAINNIKIINIIYSDICSEKHPEKCGILIHLWKPGKERLKSQLRLYCYYYGTYSYIGGGVIDMKKEESQKLFYNQIDIDKFKSLGDCHIRIFTALRLLESQTYVVRKNGVFKELYNTTKNAEFSGYNPYATGIKKFACCEPDDKICELRKIPPCELSEPFPFLTIYISIGFAVIALILITILCKRKHKKDSVSSQSESNLEEQNEEGEIEKGLNEEKEEKEIEEGINEEKVEKIEGIVEAEVTEEEAEEAEAEAEAEEAEVEAEVEAEAEAEEENEQKV